LDKEIEYLCHDAVRTLPQFSTQISALTGQMIPPQASKPPIHQVQPFRHLGQRHLDESIMTQQSAAQR